MTLRRLCFWIALTIGATWLVLQGFELASKVQDAMQQGASP